MRIRYSVSILIALVVAAGLLIGCGDGRLSKNEYIKQYNEKVSEPMQAAMGKMDTSDPKKARALAGDLAVELDKAQSELEKLEPPTEWQNNHDTMVTAMGDMADAMRDVEKAGPTDVKALTAAQKKFQTAATKGSKAEEGFKQ